MNLAITFTPDGLGKCLYTEAIELSKIGSLTVERASRIEFDIDRQVWRVLDMRGNPLHEAHSRQACLEWERAHFEDQGPLQGPEVRRRRTCTTTRPASSCSATG